MTPLTYSVVIPVFNEQDCLVELYNRLIPVMTGLGREFEIIFVDDGSTDRSLAMITDLAHRDDRVRYLSFSRNFGHEAASTAGLDHAAGAAVILIDADLQDPPETIPALVAKWHEGYQVAYAERRTRRGESVATRLSAFLFYRFLGRFAEVPIPLDTGDFRLMDRRVVDDFKQCRERNRFVRGLVSWVGYRQTGVAFDRQPRRGGEGKYNFLKRLLLSLNAITGFSILPLRLALLIGLLVVGLSLLGGLTVLFQKLFLGLPIPGYAFLVLSIFFLGGTQLLLLGVVGEYVGKIYIEIKGRPLYILAKQAGWDSEHHGQSTD